MDKTSTWRVLLYILFHPHTWKTTSFSICWKNVHQFFHSLNQWFRAAIFFTVIVFIACLVIYYPMMVATCYAYLGGFGAPEPDGLYFVPDPPACLQDRFTLHLDHTIKQGVEFSGICALFFFISTPICWWLDKEEKNGKTKT